MTAMTTTALPSGEWTLIYTATGTTRILVQNLTPSSDLKVRIGSAVDDGDAITADCAFLRPYESHVYLVENGDFVIAAPVQDVPGSVNVLTEADFPLTVTGNVTAGLTGHVTTAAPTYTNGTDQAFSLDLTGALRVDRVVNATAAAPSNARIASAASTNATSVKASSGNVYSITVGNTSASAAYVKFYNKASAPTVGSDTPVLTLLVYAHSTVSIPFSVPLRFSTGIAYATTAGVADADSAAVGLNDLHGLIQYV